jgi:hypothetical protein
MNHLSIICQVFVSYNAIQISILKAYHSNLNDAFRLTSKYQEVLDSKSYIVCCLAMSKLMVSPPLPQGALLSGEKLVQEHSRHCWNLNRERTRCSLMGPGSRPSPTTLRNHFNHGHPGVGRDPGATMRWMFVRVGTMQQQEIPQKIYSWPSPRF